MKNWFKKNWIKCIMAPLCFVMFIVHEFYDVEVTSGTISSIYIALVILFMYSDFG